MSDLQLGLIVLGALVVVSVILYNWWQERRLLRESSAHFSTQESDALMEEFRIDDPLAPKGNEAVDENFYLDDPMPTLVDTYDSEAAAQPAVQSAGETPGRTLADDLVAPKPEETEAVAATEPVEAAASDVMPVPDTLPAEVSASVDLIARLRLRVPLGGEAASQALQAVGRPSKPMLCFVQTDDGAWHAADDAAGEAGVVGMACALQLADRNGPVSQPVLGKFRADMESLAAAAGADLEWIGNENPVGYAAELDQFCVAVDVMAGFHLLHGEDGPFAGTKLRGLAEAGGMQLHADGAFHFANDAGQTLFTMISHDQRPFRPETLRTIFYRGLSFQLDVPRVSGCVEAFNQMALFARKLEASLGGRLVDDNQRLVGDAEMDKIRQQLKSLQARMQEHGIVAGSPTALRLFS